MELSVGDTLKAENANWNFKGEVALNFDAHVSKSVPFYTEGHHLICQLSDYFLKPESVCYEIGCSTGQLLSTIAEHNQLKKNIRYIGIDVEEDMVALAQKKTAENPALQFVVEDVLTCPLETSDMIVAYYTVQFIHPAHRQQVIDRLYKSLNWGGCLVLFEKVRAADARFQDMMTGIYNEYKLNQGYSPTEIVAKSRSLKGVLEPFSTQGNLDLLKRAGFSDVMSVFKYVCFEGFLAIK